MRKITYICDCCGREYPYELKAGDKDRSILATVLNKELCRRCLKKAIELLFAKTLTLTEKDLEQSTLCPVKMNT